MILLENAAATTKLLYRKMETQLLVALLVILMSPREFLPFDKVIL